MRYRVIKIGYHKNLYQPQYFDESRGWKVAYANDDEHNRSSYFELEDAKEACRIHAMEQPEVVWSDNF